MEFTLRILVWLAVVALVSSLTNALKPISVDSLAPNSNSAVCLNRIGDLDKCLPKLIVYGDRNFDPPRSEDQLDKHCRMLDVNHKCVSSYSRECLPSFARNLYSVALRRLKTQFGKRCKTKDGRRDFLALMACADPVTMEPSHKCMDAFVAHLEHIGNGNQNRQIELACCTFQVFQECIFDASRRAKCANREVSAEKTIEYVTTLIESMGGDMMDFVCGRYDKVSTCQSGYPEIMSQFELITQRVRNGTLKAKATTPLKPLLQLFVSNQD